MTALRHPRQCVSLDDPTFATLCVLHVSKSGRDFLQTHGIPACPQLTRGSYFKNLSSKRRLKFMRDLADHLNRSYLPVLRAADDLLAANILFIELPRSLLSWGGS